MAYLIFDEKDISTKCLIIRRQFDYLSNEQV